MAVFDWAIDVAKELIAENGETNAFTIFAAEASDPDKPWRTDVPKNRPFDVTACWLNINQVGAGQGYLAPPDVTHTEYKKILIAAKDLPEVLTIKAEIARPDGRIYKIHRLLPLDPNGEMIIYTAYVYR